MPYDFLKDSSLNSKNGNDFNELDLKEINEIENEIYIPKDLLSFYKEVGYGFLNKKLNPESINRIMDPFSYKEVNRREDFYEFDPDLEVYEELYGEDNIYLFLELNEGVYLGIDKKVNDEGHNDIYYFSEIIASSLEEFLEKYTTEGSYFVK